MKLVFITVQSFVARFRSFILLFTGPTCPYHPSLPGPSRHHLEAERGVEVEHGGSGMVAARTSTQRSLAGRTRSGGWAELSRRGALGWT